MPNPQQFRKCAGVLVFLMPSIGLAQAIGGPLTPLPAVPVLAPQRVELGRSLFNDPRLSSNASLSCASCHRLDQGGADGQVRAILRNDDAALEVSRRCLPTLRERLKHL